MTEEEDGLTPEARACLRDLAGGPLMLWMDWASDGERRRVFSYYRVGAERHQASAVIQLGVKQLAEFKPPEFDLLVLTPLGRDYARRRGWLKDEPSPGPAPSG